jgi:hypothetical protein
VHRACRYGVDELRERLDEGGLTTALVSTPEGKLSGVVTRSALAGWCRGSASRRLGA